MPKHMRTVCLEFFGQARDAIPSIVEITDHLERRSPQRACCSRASSISTSAICARSATTKSKRGALPKMVLIGDLVGDDENAVARATSEVVRIANGRAGEGFIAVGADARKFWLDRAAPRRSPSTPTRSRSTRTS
jgi:FAD/FMN-containing dehydrogenase